jgi:serine/threonine protein kinase
LKSINLAEYFKEEIESLKELVHPNLIRLKEAYPEGTLVKDDGSTEQVMYIVLELAEKGHLFDYIAKIPAYDERTPLHYFKQLIEALEYMHNHGISHRELKYRILCSTMNTSSN